MPLVRNVNTTMSDSGGGKRTGNTKSNANSYNNGLYGSYYGGASAGKTGSSLGVYGSQYAGASASPKPTNTSTPNLSSNAQSAIDKLRSAVGDNLKKGTSVLGQTPKNPDYIPVSYNTGGGDIGGSTGPSVSFNVNTNDDIVNKIKDLLTEQKNRADEYYRTLYENQLSQNRQGYEANRNQINRNYMRGERYINSIYGNGNSGSGITNRLRNASNWTNNLTTNRQNLENNNAQALAGYNSNLANTANTLAQGWYNYVLPVYENRQINADNNEYAYRRYLASL